MPQIEVSFDIDANGILHVGAKDKGTGKENKITIKANSGLTEAEIQQMVKDAELNAADDKKKVELVQARNQAEAMVHSVKKSLGEHGDKLDAGEKDAIESAIKAVEKRQGRRQGRHRGQDRSPDDRQPEAGREGLRRLAGRSGCGPVGRWRGFGWQQQGGRRRRGRRRGQGSQARLMPRADGLTPPPRPGNLARRFCSTEPPIHHHGQTRFLRSPGRSQERVRRRDQEGVSQAGDEAPPGPQPG
jgi:ElaB/YqjD/DUF883 family membrane-anchored ribosome-binding protein